MNFKAFLRIVEIRTKIVSASTLLLATLFVVSKGISISWFDWTLLAIAAFAVDMGTTAFNSFFDFEYGVDTRTLNLERDKVLVHDAIPPGYALLTAIALYALALSLGLVLGIRHGLWVIAAGLGSVAIGFFYTGGPKPISYTPFGEVFAGGTLGTVFFVISAGILGAGIDSTLLWFTVPSTLCIAAILTVNNTCDMVGDTLAGRRTLSIVLGKAGGRMVLQVLVLASGIVAFLLFIQEFMATGIVAPLVWSICLLLFLVMVVAELVAMARRDYSHATKGQNMGSISKIFLLLTILMVCGFVIRLWLNYTA